MSNEQDGRTSSYVDFSEIISSGKYEGVSGLDMAPTLEWYHLNRDFLKGVLERNIQFAPFSSLPQTENLDLLTVDRELLGRIRGLFPAPARQRSLTTKIIGASPLWFHRDSLHAGQQPTTTPEEALSPTAFIPGFTSYEQWPEAQIYLYQVPPQVTEDPIVASLITAEAAVHEELHATTAKLFYGNNYLRIPSGELIHGYDFTVGVFGELAQGHTPITHYSSQFRDEQGRFANPDDPRTAIWEELAETSTVLLLGYGSGVRTDLRFDPLADRNELKAVIRDLLQGEIVPGPDDDSDLSTTSVDELKEYYLQYQ